MPITIERVVDIVGCQACHNIATKVWGEASACSVPQLLVHAAYGGVILLAYDEHRPIGFVFSFPALYQGAWVLWSHETAVLPAYLHQGIGLKLKLEQQVQATQLGYFAIAWTFDPLVSRNAHFNLNKLGAEVSEYKVNAYGVMEDLINGSIETDRFVAKWQIEPIQPIVPTKVATATCSAARRPFVDHPVYVWLDVSAPARGFSAPLYNEVDFANTSNVSVETIETRIPLNTEAIFQTSPALAQQWRIAFREVALRLSAVGYQVVAFYRDSDYGSYFWKPTESER